jgi:hypothetical protein
MERVRGKTKVEWLRLGEGLRGDYDKAAQEDIELLRFDLSVLDEDGVWESKESYCTRFPADASDKLKRAGLEYLMDRLYEPVSKGET